MAITVPCDAYSEPVTLNLFYSRIRSDQYDSPYTSPHSAVRLKIQSTEFERPTHAGDQ